MTKTFVRFVEHNDWEGETWKFWLQLTGNEEEMGRLAEAIREAEVASGLNDFPYELHLEDVVNEPTVDALVMFGDEGYMDEHNKVEGVLTVPVPFEDADLYKGGIKDLFRG